MKKLLTTAYALALLAVLGGCQTQPNQQASIEEKSSSQANTQDTQAQTKAEQPTPPVPVEYRKFPTDTLYSLLVAELAATRQDFDTTLDHYIEQAHATNDKAVIARAARIAQFFREHDSTLSMSRLWLAQEPQNIEANTLIANAYLELNQPLKALDYTEILLRELKALSQEPQHAGRDGGAFAETIANFAKRSNQETRLVIIARFKALLEQYPELTGIKVALSSLYQSNGEIEQAFDWVTQALTQEPERTSAIVQEILLLQQNKQYPLAISKLKVQLEKQPTNQRLRLIYARLLTTNNLDEAYAQFTLLSEQSPRQLDLKFSRALLATELGKMQTAKPLLEELFALDYQRDTVNFYLGHVDEALLKLGSALKHYLAVSAGDNYLAAQNRAARIYIKQGKTDKAQALFVKLRKAHPKQIESLYVSESDLLVRQKLNEPALALLNEAIQHYPDNIDLRYNRSTVYERIDKLALMESDFRHILAIDPNNAHALNGLGYFLAIRTQRFEEAYQLIAKALSIKPGDAAIIDSMGWVAFKMGRLDEALAHLEKAFALYPDPEVAAHLGEVLWVKGDKQKARDIWEQNLNDNPNAPEILETLQRLGVSL